MDTPFSKSRKRQRTSSDEAMSFMKNVTSRMSGLLPTTITKWFSNNSPNANGSAAKVDVTDSSSDDEAPETPSQVPAKRKRFTSPTICNNISSTEMNSDNSDHFAVIEYASSKDMLRRDTIIASTSKKVTEDESFDRKEKETDNSIFKAQHTVSAIGKSVAAKRKSLFDTYNKNMETISTSAQSSQKAQSHVKQPYFKPVLLGSPFYPGMTMYGGAGSCYMNTTNIKRKKVEVVKNEGKNDTSVMSMSTRRVMDLLEHYSSPLTEAKRIPQYTKPSVHEKANDSDVNMSSGKSNKYQELCVPRYLGVITFRPKSRLTNMTHTARQLLASHSSSDTTPYPTNNYKQGDDTDSMASGHLITKMKKKITRAQRGNATKDAEETVAPVEFKSSPLKIDADKLPTFPLQNNPFPGPITSTPKPSSMLSSTLNTDTTITSKIVPLTKNDTVPANVPNNIFTFANPIKITCKTTENIPVPALFTFDSSDKQMNKREEKIIEASLENKTKSTEKIKVEWTCPDCWVNNKPDAEKCVCCGGKPESKLSKSMQSKCDDNQSKNTKIVSSLTVPCIETPNNSLNQLQKVSQWKCDTCWVDNDTAADKCICCGASNPKNSTIHNTNIFMDKDWKCDYCGLFNKSVSDKCVACGKSNLGSSNSAPILKTTLTVPHKPAYSSSLQEIVKRQKSGSWECRICLVTNFINSSRCQCCDAQKELKGPKVNFKFGVNSDFKFGNALKEQEAIRHISTTVHEDPMCEEKPKVDKSEANNNNLAETPSFTFILPVKKSEEKVESAPKKSQESKPCFKFGISHQIHIDPVSKEIVKEENPTELPKPAEIDEKPQEVPSVDLLNPKTISNSLIESALVTSSNNVALGSMFKNTNVIEKKETSSNISILQQDLLSSTDKLQPQHSFSFSTGVKPNLSFFTTVPSTTTATIVIDSSKEPNLATVTAPTLLFQNTVTTAATSSMFTFGTKTTQNNAIPEKPQFPFKFGNNKNDVPLTFKSMFGSTTDNSAKKFGISTGSTAVAPNTAQTANTTDSSKGLSPANMLTGSQNMRLSPGDGSGLPTNSANVGNGFVSATTVGGNGFSPKSVSGGNNLNTGLTISGTGLNTGNPMGRNTLNVGNNLDSTTLNSGNALSGNGLNMDNALGGRLATGSTNSGNTLSAVGPLGGNGSNNNMFANHSPNPAYSLQTATTATPLFGQTVQKENMWSMSNPANTNSVIPNTTSKEPATFTFSSTPFNASNSTPAFGNNTQTSTNVFGLNQNQNTQNTGTIFSISPRNISSIFGSPSAANNQTSAPNIFSPSNMGAAPTFGTPTPSNPSFETPSLTPAPAAPAFNFGMTPSTGVFGFGQQQQPAGPGTGVYNFSATGSASQVQFNMGMGSSAIPGRRIKKAMRRSTTQR
ncbi:hypothetical protein K1T71_000479 [Dendrolimus kikuchii]|uniref:Uncharacterized protein n=1 Tax=Dendrolimus kikuchii TaxID=765133 RepID=A0ACC1DJN8_9NEOP|nr:hypothetical protein K1T71_000479 [Dendrolimus kikuchii]